MPVCPLHHRVTLIKRSEIDVGFASGVANDRNPCRDLPAFVQSAGDETLAFVRVFERVQLVRDRQDRAVVQVFFAILKPNNVENEIFPVVHSRVLLRIEFRPLPPIAG